MGIKFIIVAKTKLQLFISQKNLKDLKAFNKWKSKTFWTLLLLFQSLPTRFASVAATAQILYWFWWLRHGGGLTGPQNRLYYR